MASSRIQRWALKLSAYQYSICYKSGKTLQNVDALSRLPMSVTCNHDGLTGDISHLMDHLSSTTISCANIQKWTNMSCKVSLPLSWIVHLFHTSPEPWNSLWSMFGEPELWHHSKVGKLFLTSSMKLILGAVK